MLARAELFALSFLFGPFRLRVIHWLFWVGLFIYDSLTTCPLAVSRAMSRNNHTMVVITMTMVVIAVTMVIARTKYELWRAAYPVMMCCVKPHRA
ncbi:hypothetical protein F5Y14DRAFT_420397 [Nemania sp. NC0429]|nr:hypothetical protein F5Y14DRAFT_420397 [Nemania sp. NC0429]